MTKQTKSRGFTIVELLIVIVVIAILAAITIVAYNGIQNRAKASSAASAATAAAKKIESYNAINSQYPNVAGVITGTATQNSVATTTTSDWYSAQSTAFTTNATIAATAPSDPKSVFYVANGTNGGCIYYWDYTATAGWGAYKWIQAGTATCAALTAAPTVTAI